MFRLWTTGGAPAGWIQESLMRLGRYGRFVIAAAVVTVGLALTSCSGSGDPKPTPNTTLSQSTPTQVVSTAPVSTPPSASPTRTPDEAAAVAAYLSFVRTIHKWQRTPGPGALPELERYSIDPGLGLAADTLTKLQVYGLSFKGTPPVARVSVVGRGKRTLIELVDCPTVAQNWAPYSVATGKPAQSVPNKVHPPFATKSDMVSDHGRWVVRSTSTDTSKTCTP